MMDRNAATLRREGEAATFAKILRRQRSEHTASFNALPDIKKADAHQALEILAAYPDARSLADLARAEAIRLNAAAKSKLLRLIIDELLVEKRADGRRERYITGLRGALNVFERAFPDRLASSLTAVEITAWLRGAIMRIRTAGIPIAAIWVCCSLGH